MSHEREQDRARHTADPVQRDIDATPSRATRSSQLDAPTNPITSGLIQRKARDANGVAGDADQAVAAAASGGGSALPDTLMRKFESSLGTDLSSVRVHTGGDSATAAHAVGAKAYTMGQDIHFGAGQYNPASPGGQHLIAHEVAHTVQQRGGSPTRQNKLEVSSPHDAAEHEADRAADAMITGAPAQITGAPVTAARKEDMDSKIQNSGDQAQSQAWKTPLSIDTLTVNTDRSRVSEIISDIDAQNGNLRAAEKDDSGLEARSAPRATNTATKVNLSVFNDKLDIANVDTTAFASQYRFAFADYQRLKAEASAYTSLSHRTRGGEPMETVTGEYSYGQGSKGLEVAATAEKERFRASRQNLNSAAQKMNAKMTLVRGAANTMQAATYRIKAAAAKAASEAAAAKLATINQEIADVASGVSTVVKIAAAVAGLAGGAGATDGLASSRTAAATADGAGSATIDPSNYAKSLGWSGEEVGTDPAKQSQLSLMGAMGKDAASVVVGGGGDMATSLVTAIGTYANKDKIATLQSNIIEQSQKDKSFNAAADAATLVGAQATLEGHAGELQVLSQAFAQAKFEEREAGQALMAKLKSSGGAKGTSQARAVMFLTDTDRFLAQVIAAIAAGKSQQATIRDAAGDRKSLRGTSTALGEVRPGETEHGKQLYYRVSKVVTKGVIYGTNTRYKLDPVFVTFQDNANSQGGKGTIEGHGGAGDDVANKLKALEMAKTEVQELQKAVQHALGLGAPGINA